MILLLMLSVLGSPFSRYDEHVDLIELNHFYDLHGKHVYDQAIVYEHDPSNGLFNVRAWKLIERPAEYPTQSFSPRPASGRGAGGEGSRLLRAWTMQWHDRDKNLVRNLRTNHLRETWTQVDPERVNKVHWPEQLRVPLITIPTSPD